jgi:hypothetical protein
LRFQYILEICRRQGERGGGVELGERAGEECPARHPGQVRPGGVDGISFSVQP